MWPRPVSYTHLDVYKRQREAYLAGRQSPVFFGSGVNNFGVQPLLDFFVEHAPSPRARATTTREVEAEESKLTGFVFKIQANMDPMHRDRVAFMRVCSGKFEAGMKAFHPRTGKDVKLANALTFMASDREIAESAFPGDVIGIHNHGTVSYTHLDVYKRQMSNRCVSCLQMMKHRVGQKIRKWP